MAGRDLGVRYAVGVLSGLNLVTPGAWLVQFDTNTLPLNMDFEMHHAAVTGPGGYFLVYRDGDLYGTAANGRINEYNPRGKPMFVRRGQVITFHWSIATGAAPRVWIYLKQPD